MQHHFDIDDAKKYGIECAILLNNLRFWIAKNEANKKHFYNGRYWTYNSATAFTKLFPYWSSSQISRYLRRLEDYGLIVSDNFNQSSYDKTKWYSLNYTTDCLKMNNGSDEIEQPIPDIKSDLKPVLVITPDGKNAKSFKQWTLEDFGEELKKFADIVIRDDLTNFYNHWREKDAKGKMKLQNQRTWETNLRLNKWLKNKEIFEKPKYEKTGGGKGRREL
jgi:hypothetical protein